MGLVEKIYFKLFGKTFKREGNTYYCDGFIPRNYNK